MSISDFFNRKARALAAAAAITLGGAGGYVGMQAGDNYHQPQISNFAFDSVRDKDTVDEKAFYAGRIPGVGETAAQRQAVSDFTARIDGLAANRSSPTLAADSASLIRDLRTSSKISEENYQSLVKDYDKRVGLDVTPLVGNYRKGVAFNQECQVAQAFGSLFGDEEDLTPAQESDEIGSCMMEAQQQRDHKAMEGGAAGAAIGGMLGLPLWLRRRKQGPQVFKNRKP